MKLDPKQDGQEQVVVELNSGRARRPRLDSARVIRPLWLPFRGGLRRGLGLVIAIA